MENYHMQKKDREITNNKEIEEILKSELIMTMAMSKNNQPYLVTMDYYYNQQEDAIYFHCANDGKKKDYLKENPNVWVEVMQDHGYIKDECSHAYKSVHLKGKIEFIENDEIKREILEEMIRKFEKNPQKMITRFLKKPKKLMVSIGKIKIEEKWGKENFS